MNLLYRILLTIWLLLLMTAGPALAQQQTRTYRVKAGETLFGIAEKHGVTVQQLKQWNNLTGSQLSVGQELQIRQPRNTAGDAGPESGQNGLTHTVQPKETLYSISRKYGVTIADIRSWNNVQGQNLAVGTQLRLYPDRAAADAGNTAPDTQGASYYRVKSGDSLFRIADAHNMTVARLKELNNLRSNTIQVGQRLAVQPTDQPPSLAMEGVQSSAQGNFMRYTVKEQQSRSELLQTFQMDESEFRALNPGRTATTFRRGDEVIILAPPTRRFRNPYEVSRSMSSLGTAPARRYQVQGIATTTSGELYNPRALTAAHPSMAMGSVIFVQNPQTDRGVLVRINDRTTGDGLKLSDAAWQTLALSGSSAQVTLFREDD